MNADSKYFDEYYDFVLKNKEPDSKAKKKCIFLLALWLL